MGVGSVLCQFRVCSLAGQTRNAFRKETILTGHSCRFKWEKWLEKGIAVICCEGMMGNVMSEGRCAAVYPILPIPSIARPESIRLSVRHTGPTGLWNSARLCAHVIRAATTLMRGWNPDGASDASDLVALLVGGYYTLFTTCFVVIVSWCIHTHIQVLKIQNL